jgi:hypothetical protein
VADRKITDLTALTTPAIADVLPIVDVSEAAAADKNKKITVGELFKGVPDGTAAAPSVAFTGSGTDTGIYSPGVDQVAVSTGGTGRLFIDASGKVGVNTTSEGAQLHVLIGTSGKSWTAPTGTSALFERNSINYVTIAAANNNTSQLNFADTDDADIGSIKYNHAEDSLSFGVNNGERARIDSSGRLLVGTSTSRAVGGSIQSNLQIEGTGTGASTTSCSVTQNSNSIDGPRFMLAKSRGTANGSVTIVQSGDNLGTIDFAGADGTDAGSSAVRISAQVDGTPGANDMPGRLVFSTTADGASSPTERLRITSAGNVGIGITSPAAALHVVTSGAGEIRHADGARAVAMGSTGTISYIGSVTAGNGLALYSANEEKARIDASGRLGIGNSSPGSFYSGSNQLVVGNTGDQGITIKTGTSDVGRLHFADGTTGNQAYRGRIEYVHASDYMQFGTAGRNSDLVIDSSGRVGIGTASPAYKCDIDVTGSAVRLNSTTSQALLVISSDDAANAKIEFGDESDNDRGAITYDNPNNALIFQANAAERVRIESGGKTKFSGGAYGIERTATAGAFDLNTGNFWTCGAIAIPNPTNQVAGMMGSLRVTAAPTSFAANWKHPGGTYTAPTTFPAVAPFYVQASGTILLGSWTEGIA